MSQPNQTPAKSPADAASGGYTVAKGSSTPNFSASKRSSLHDIFFSPLPLQYDPQFQPPLPSNQLSAPPMQLSASTDQMNNSSSSSPLQFTTTTLATPPTHTSHLLPTTHLSNVPTSPVHEISPTNANMPLKQHHMSQSLPHTGSILGGLAQNDDFLRISSNLGSVLLSPPPNAQRPGVFHATAQPSQLHNNTNTSASTPPNLTTTTVYECHRHVLPQPLPPQQHVVKSGWLKKKGRSFFGVYNRKFVTLSTLDSTIAYSDKQDALFPTFFFPLHDLVRAYAKKDNGLVLVFHNSYHHNNALQAKLVEQDDFLNDGVTGERSTNLIDAQTSVASTLIHNTEKLYPQSNISNDVAPTKGPLDLSLQSVMKTLITSTSTHPSSSNDDPDTTTNSAFSSVNASTPSQQVDKKTKKELDKVKKEQLAAKTKREHDLRQQERSKAKKAASSMTNTVAQPQQNKSDKSAKSDARQDYAPNQSHEEQEELFILRLQCANQKERDEWLLAIFRAVLVLKQRTHARLSPFQQYNSLLHIYRYVCCQNAKLASSLIGLLRYQYQQMTKSAQHQSEMMKKIQFLTTPASPTPLLPTNVSAASSSLFFLGDSEKKNELSTNSGSSQSSHPLGSHLATTFRQNQTGQRGSVYELSTTINNSSVQAHRMSLSNISTQRTSFIPTTFKPNYTGGSAQYGSQSANSQPLTHYKFSKINQSTMASHLRYVPHINEHTLYGYQCCNQIDGGDARADLLFSHRISCPYHPNNLAQNVSQSPPNNALNSSQPTSSNSSPEQSRDAIQQPKQHVPLTPPRIIAQSRLITLRHTLSKFIGLLIYAYNSPSANVKGTISTSKKVDVRMLTSLYSLQSFITTCSDVELLLLLTHLVDLRLKLVHNNFFSSDDSYVTYTVQRSFDHLPGFLANKLKPGQTGNAKADKNENGANPISTNAWCFDKLEKSGCSVPSSSDITAQSTSLDVFTPTPLGLHSDQLDFAAPIDPTPPKPAPSGCKSNIVVRSGLHSNTNNLVSSQHILNSATNSGSKAPATTPTTTASTMRFNHRRSNSGVNEINGPPIPFVTALMLLQTENNQPLTPRHQQPNTSPTQFDQPKIYSRDRIASINGRGSISAMNNSSNQPGPTLTPLDLDHNTHVVTGTASEPPSPVHQSRTTSDFSNIDQLVSITPQQFFEKYQVANALERGIGAADGVLGSNIANGMFFDDLKSLTFPTQSSPSAPTPTPVLPTSPPPVTTSLSFPIYFVIALTNFLCDSSLIQQIGVEISNIGNAIQFDADSSLSALHDKRKVNNSPPDLLNPSSMGSNTDDIVSSPPAGGVKISERGRVMEVKGLQGRVRSVSRSFAHQPLSSLSNKPLSLDKQNDSKHSTPSMKEQQKTKRTSDPPRKLVNVAPNVHVSPQDAHLVVHNPKMQINRDALGKKSEYAIRLTHMTIELTIIFIWSLNLMRLTLYEYRSQIYPRPHISQSKYPLFTANGQLIDKDCIKSTPNIPPLYTPSPALQPLVLPNPTDYPMENAINLASSDISQPLQPAASRVHRTPSPHLTHQHAHQRDHSTQSAITSSLLTNGLHTDPLVDRYSSSDLDLLAGQALFEFITTHIIVNKFDTNQYTIGLRNRLISTVFMLMTTPGSLLQQQQLNTTYKEFFTWQKAHQQWKSSQNVPPSSSSSIAPPTQPDDSSSKLAPINPAHSNSEASGVLNRPHSSDLSRGNPNLALGLGIDQDNTLSVLPTSFRPSPFLSKLSHSELNFRMEISYPHAFDQAVRQPLGPDELEATEEFSIWYNMSSAANASHDAEINSLLTSEKNSTGTTAKLGPDLFRRGSLSLVAPSKYQSFNVPNATSLLPAQNRTKIVQNENPTSLPLLDNTDGTIYHAGLWPCLIYLIQDCDFLTRMIAVNDMNMLLNASVFQTYQFQQILGISSSSGSPNPTVLPPSLTANDPASSVTKTSSKQNERSQARRDKNQDKQHDKHDKIDDRDSIIEKDGRVSINRITQSTLSFIQSTTQQAVQLPHKVIETMTVGQLYHYLQSLSQHNPTLTYYNTQLRELLKSTMEEVVAFEQVIQTSHVHVFTRQLSCFLDNPTIPLSVLNQLHQYSLNPYSSSFVMKNVLNIYQHHLQFANNELYDTMQENPHLFVDYGTYNIPKSPFLLQQYSQMCSRGQHESTPCTAPNCDQNCKNTTPCVQNEVNPYYHGFYLQTEGTIDDLQLYISCITRKLAMFNLNFSAFSVIEELLIRFITKVIQRHDEYNTQLSAIRMANTSKPNSADAKHPQTPSMNDFKANPLFNKQTLANTGTDKARPSSSSSCTSATFTFGGKKKSEGDQPTASSSSKPFGAQPHSSTDLVVVASPSPRAALHDHFFQQYNQQQLSVEQIVRDRQKRGFSPSPHVQSQFNSCDKPTTKTSNVTVKGMTGPNPATTNSAQKTATQPKAVPTSPPPLQVIPDVSEPEPITIHTHVASVLEQSRVFYNSLLFQPTAHPQLTLISNTIMDPTLYSTGPNSSSITAPGLYIPLEDALSKQFSLAAWYRERYVELETLRVQEDSSKQHIDTLSRVLKQLEGQKFIYMKSCETIVPSSLSRANKHRNKFNQMNIHGGAASGKFGAFGQHATPSNSHNHPVPTTPTLATHNGLPIVPQPINLNVPTNSGNFNPASPKSPNMISTASRRYSAQYVEPTPTHFVPLTPTNNNNNNNNANGRGSQRFDGPLLPPGGQANVSQVEENSKEEISVEPSHEHDSLMQSAPKKDGEGILTLQPVPSAAPSSHPKPHDKLTIIGHVIPNLDLLDISLTANQHLCVLLSSMTNAYSFANQNLSLFVCPVAFQCEHNIDSAIELTYRLSTCRNGEGSDARGSGKSKRSSGGVLGSQLDSIGSSWHDWLFTLLADISIFHNYTSEHDQIGTQQNFITKNFESVSLTLHIITTSIQQILLTCLKFLYTQQTITKYVQAIQISQHRELEKSLKDFEYYQSLQNQRRGSKLPNFNNFNQPLMTDLDVLQPSPQFNASAQNSPSLPSPLDFGKRDIDIGRISVIDLQGRRSSLISGVNGFLSPTKLTQAQSTQMWFKTPFSQHILHAHHSILVYTIPFDLTISQLLQSALQYDSFIIQEHQMWNQLYDQGGSVAGIAISSLKSHNSSQNNGPKMNAFQRSKIPPLGGLSVDSQPDQSSDYNSSETSKIGKSTLTHAGAGGANNVGFTMANFNGTSSQSSYTGPISARFLQYVNKHPSVFANHKYIDSVQRRLLEQLEKQESEKNSNATPAHGKPGNTGAGHDKSEHKSELSTPMSSLLSPTSETSITSTKEKKGFFKSFFGGKDDKNDKSGSKEVSKKDDKAEKAAQQEIKDANVSVDNEQLPQVALELLDNTQIDISSSPSILVVLRLSLLASHSMMNPVLSNFKLNTDILDKIHGFDIENEDCDSEHGPTTHKSAQKGQGRGDKNTSKDDYLYSATSSTQGDLKSKHSQTLPHRQHHFIDLIQNSFFLSALSKAYTISPAICVDMLLKTISESSKSIERFENYKLSLKNYKKQHFSTYLSHLQSEYMQIHGLNTVLIQSDTDCPPHLYSLTTPLAKLTDPHSQSLSNFMSPAPLHIGNVATNTQYSLSTTPNKSTPSSPKHNAVSFTQAPASPNLLTQTPQLTRTPSHSSHAATNPASTNGANQKSFNLLLNPNKAMEIISHSQLISTFDPFSLAEFVRTWLVQAISLSSNTGGNANSNPMDQQTPSVMSASIPPNRSRAASATSQPEFSETSSVSVLSTLKPGDSLPAQNGIELIFVGPDDSYGPASRARPASAAQSGSRLSININDDASKPTSQNYPITPTNALRSSVSNTDDPPHSAVYPDGSSSPGGDAASNPINAHFGAPLAPHMEDSGDDSYSQIGQVATTTTTTMTTNDPFDQSRWETYDLAPAQNQVLSPSAVSSIQTPQMGPSDSAATSVISNASSTGSKRLSLLQPNNHYTPSTPSYQTQPQTQTQQQTTQAQPYSQSVQATPTSRQGHNNPFQSDNYSSPNSQFQSTPLQQQLLRNTNSPQQLGHNNQDSLKQQILSHTTSSAATPLSLRSFAHFLPQHLVSVQRIQLLSTEHLIPLLETMHTHSVTFVAFIDFIISLPRQINVKSTNAPRTGSLYQDHEKAPHPQMYKNAHGREYDRSDRNDNISLQKYDNNTPSGESGRQSMNFSEFGGISLVHPNNNGFNATGQTGGSMQPPTPPDTFNNYGGTQQGNSSPGGPGSNANHTSATQPTTSTAPPSSVSNYWSLLRVLKLLARYEVSLLSDLVTFFNYISSARYRITGSRPILFNHDDLHTTYLLTPNYREILATQSIAHAFQTRSSVPNRGGKIITPTPHPTPHNDPNNQSIGSALLGLSTTGANANVNESQILKMLSLSLFVSLILTEARHLRHKLFIAYNEKSKLYQLSQQEHETQVSQLLDQRLAKERLLTLQNRHVLIIGNTQAGKNTFIKQSIRLYTRGFSLAHQDVVDHLLFLRIALIFKLILLHSDMKTLAHYPFASLQNLSGATSVSLHFSDIPINPFKISTITTSNNTATESPSIATEDDYFASSTLEARQLILSFKIDTYINQREYLYNEQCHAQNRMRIQSIFQTLDDIRTSVLVACAVLWSDPAAKLILDNHTRIPTTQIPGLVSPTTNTPLEASFEDGDLYILSRLPVLTLAPYRVGYVTNADVVALHSFSCYNALYLLSRNNFQHYPAINSSNYNQIIDTMMMDIDMAKDSSQPPPDDSNNVNASLPALPPITSISHLCQQVSKFNDVRSQFVGQFNRLGHPYRQHDPNMSLLFQLPGNFDLDNASGQTQATRLCQDIMLETGSFTIDSISSNLSDVSNILYGSKDGLLTFSSQQPRANLQMKASAQPALDVEPNFPAVKPERKKSLFGRKPEEPSPSLTSSPTSAPPSSMALSPTPMLAPNSNQSGTGSGAKRGHVRNKSASFSSPGDKKPEVSLLGPMDSQPGASQTSGAGTPSLFSNNHQGASGSKLSRITGGSLTTVTRPSKHHQFNHELLHFTANGLLEANFIPQRSVSYSLLSSRSTLFTRFIRGMAQYLGTTNVDTIRSRTNMNKFLNTGGGGASNVSVSSISQLFGQTLGANPGDKNSQIPDQLSALVNGGASANTKQATASLTNNLKFLAQLDANDVIMHVLSLSSYNEFDSNKNNKLLQSLSELETILANPMLADKPVVVVLNKLDLFTQKLKTVPLSTCFSKYQERLHLPSSYKPPGSATMGPAGGPLQNSMSMANPGGGQNRYNMNQSFAQSPGLMIGAPQQRGAVASPTAFQNSQSLIGSMSTVNGSYGGSNMPLGRMQTTASPQVVGPHPCANNFLCDIVTPSDEIIIKSPFIPTQLASSDQAETLDDAVRFLRRELLRLVQGVVNQQSGKLEQQNALSQQNQATGGYHFNNPNPGAQNLTQNTAQPSNTQIVCRHINISQLVDDWYQQNTLSCVTRAQQINGTFVNNSNIYAQPMSSPATSPSSAPALNKGSGSSGPSQDLITNIALRRKYANPYTNTEYITALDDLQQHQLQQLQNSWTTHSQYKPTQLDFDTHLNSVFMTTTPTTNHGYGASQNNAQNSFSAESAEIKGRPVLFVFTSLIDPYAVEELSILNFIATSNAELTKYSIVGEDPQFIQSPNGQTNDKFYRVNSRVTPGLNQFPSSQSNIAGASFGPQTGLMLNTQPGRGMPVQPSSIAKLNNQGTHFAGLSLQKPQQQFTTTQLPAHLFPAQQGNQFAVNHQIGDPFSPTIPSLSGQQLTFHPHPVQSPSQSSGITTPTKSPGSKVQQLPTPTPTPQKNSMLHPPDSDRDIIQPQRFNIYDQEDSDRSSSTNTDSPFLHQQSSLPMFTTSGQYGTYQNNMSMPLSSGLNSSGNFDNTINHQLNHALSPQFALPGLSVQHSLGHNQQLHPPHSSAQANPLAGLSTGAVGGAPNSYHRYRGAGTTLTRQQSGNNATLRRQPDLGVMLGNQSTGMTNNNVRLPGAPNNNPTL